MQIIHCLHYFDLFDHPLKAGEIHRFLTTESTEEQINDRLVYLIESNNVYSYNDYYGLTGVEEKVENRLKYENNAKRHYEISQTNGIIILNIPFVSGVCISGSLSKGVMKEDADIDYFIFAKNGRIWLAKFFVKAYKFLKLKNSKEMFCTNYFISDENLKIEEQNLYTATELVTLIPINSQNLYSQLLSTNKWYKDYLPNVRPENITVIERSFETNKYKAWTEALLNNPIGTILNQIIRQVFILRSHLKYKKKESTDFELMHRSSLDQIKVHEPNHQQKTLEKYNSNIKKITA